MDAELSLLQDVWSDADAKMAIDTLDAWNESNPEIKPTTSIQP